MKWIYDLSFEDLQNQLSQLGIKPFVAQQIFQWLYWKIEPDIDQWTNISKSNRILLAQHYSTELVPVNHVSGDPQTARKFLFRFTDHQAVEAVQIKEKHHYTFCISTQVGCPLACQFCATGSLGFKRNLSPGEILSQILSLKKELIPYSGKLNLVFMGMGEPLLNYSNLRQALEIITAENGIGISPRNITVSTAGILEKIKQLEQDFPNMKISFSLNASDAVMRKKLMPIEAKEPLAHILSYFRSTAKQRKHRITFEYVLLKGVNDSREDVRKIVQLLHGIPCKINIIPYNANEIYQFQSPDEQEVTVFADYLHQKGHTVIVRWSKGREIKSACGQLAAQSHQSLSVTPSQVIPLHEKSIKESK